MICVTSITANQYNILNNDNNFKLHSHFINPKKSKRDYNIPVNNNHPDKCNKIRLIIPNAKLIKNNFTKSISKAILKLFSIDNRCNETTKLSKLINLFSIIYYFIIN